MSWKDILKGHEEENHPHIQTFREKGAKTSHRLKVIGEKKRKKGQKNWRDYPLREGSWRGDSRNPIGPFVGHYIFRTIKNIVTQTDESHRSKLFDDHPDDYQDVWKNNPKLEDMAEGRLTLDQLFQQSNFEYPDHFTYKYTFMEEKGEGEKDKWGNLKEIKIPDDILAKISDKANYKVSWDSQYDESTFAETISEKLERSGLYDYFLEAVSKSLDDNVVVRYTKPGFLSEPQYTDEHTYSTRYWGIDKNAMVYVVGSMEHEKEEGPKIYPTVTRQGKEQILKPDNRRNRHQGDVPEKKRKEAANWKDKVKMQ